LVLLALAILVSAASAQRPSPGAFSKEKTQPIGDIVGRAPITTRQFVQDYKVAFS
jgi:hypothetical protein